MTTRFLILILSVTFLSTTSMNAAIPGLISYQGRITTATGAAVADGAYLIKFQIYDSAVDGSILWNSSYQNVQVQGGIYSYVLGQDVPFPSGLFTGGNRWLGVTIGVDPEMTPRQQMIATSYAFVSQNADSVDWSGIKNIPAGFADGVDNSNSGDITGVNTSGGLTGGVTSGDANISIASGGVTSNHVGDGQLVNADINPSADIAATKVAGIAGTLSGNQTFTGKNTFADSVKFSDSTMHVGNGMVKIGSTSDPISQSILSVARNHSSNAVNMLHGILVDVDNSGSAPLTGCTFLAKGTSGNVSALTTQAQTDAHFRRGAYVQAYPLTYGLGTGRTFGLQSVATDGEFCYGVHTAATSGTLAYGVYGTARLASQEGVALYGLASDNPANGLGVYGGATANGWGVGVYGEAWANSTANWAGYFGGDVNVTGTVFMPAKVSRIDHPLDPENKYLQHSDVQSPDMINVYTGNAVTDTEGNATVTLPDYFSAVNSDFRYQLTVVGQFAQAIISEEIHNNRFSIKTDLPSVKVSWQVTAIRDDLYARANRAAAVVVKPAHEAGKYLHPELYGFGDERGMLAEIRAAAMKSAEVDRQQAKEADLTRGR